LIEGYIITEITLADTLKTILVECSLFLLYSSCEHTGTRCFTKRSPRCAFAVHFRHEIGLLWFLAQHAGVFVRG